MPTIQINNQILGGIADSRYLGIANSVAKICGFDLYSEPGVLKVNQKFTKISASLIDGLIKNSVICSNGETYCFSADSGKIWRIKEDHTTVELCYTTSAGAGESKCTGASEYNGYIVWATELRLHQIAIANAKSEASWSTISLNYKTFTNGDKNYHPMEIQNDILYIGDAKTIAQLDGGTFSAAAINPWSSEHRVSVIQKYLTGILFGTIISSSVPKAISALWNTWSERVSSTDEIPEAGVNSFLKMDNYAVAQIGRKGNFYSFDGASMNFYKKIPGDWGNMFGPNQAIVNPDANINANGIPMFGLSNVSGNPAEQGIYSLGRYSPSYPIIFNLEYVISTGNVANVEIGSIVQAGSDFFVCWKDSNGTPSYGIDKLDTTAKYSGAYFESRVVALNREQQKEFLIKVPYRLLPANTDITLKTKVDSGNWSDPITLINDATRKIKFTKVKIKASAAQFRIITSASVNTAPEIEAAIISF